jgi:putative phosphoribosyl transferase
MFKDRKDAGMHLAEKLKAYAGRNDVIVLALPRGGVVTGAVIANRIKAPLDVLIVRKIGHPWEQELAAGAIAETGAIVYNEDIAQGYGVTREYLDDEVERQRGEIARRQQLYRNGEKLKNLAGKTVILVDDGVATGATMKAAIEALKREHVAKLIVAVPVSPKETAAELRKMTDEFVCLDIPEDFMAVGSYYADFRQTMDAEVVSILRDVVDRNAA